MIDNGVQDPGEDQETLEENSPREQGDEAEEEDVGVSESPESLDDDDDGPDDYGDADDYESKPDDEYERKRKRRTGGLGEAVLCRPLEVVVRDDRVEQAIRQLKNRMAREGVLRELKNRRHYFKPSELKRIKSREAARRRRKQARQKGAH